MAQLFPYKSNIIARVGLFLLATLPWILLYAGSIYSRSPYNTKVGVPEDQPVPFSHKHHVTELGLDCRFCHPAVTKSSYAGVATTETCMRCHSVIWTNSPLLEPVRESWAHGQSIQWTQLNVLPDFVYFNHSIHINRGIACSQCHGPIQEMQLTSKGVSFQMSWCLDCHRAVDRNLYTDPSHPELTPAQQVFNLYVKVQDGTPLTPRERVILSGGVYDPTPKEIEEGKMLIKKCKVKEAQLADCSICHY